MGTDDEHETAGFTRIPGAFVARTPCRNACRRRPHEHTVRIYALDEELLIDRLMLDFDLERKHYLIPVQ
jgi:hypothetical protein